MTDLIITNGDSAADLLAEAGKSGRILPWRDVLHEGPILAELDDCTMARVGYLAERFRIAAADVAADFAVRDAIIKAHGGFDRVELWFEHDLYDQLQLLQILAFFAGSDRRDRLILVQADDFLGRQRADTILRFAGKARPIGIEDLDLGRDVWRHLASPSPATIADWLNDPDERLPYLRPALLRFFQELPAPGSGLGRTEMTALRALANGPAAMVDVFRAVLADEEAPFMGDSSVFRLIEDMALADAPLIAGLAPPDATADEERYADARLELTIAGEDVLNGEDDNIALNGIDRWWAGTHLTPASVWRYDRHRARLVAPSEN